jgi:hypothetical protein
MNKILIPGLILCLLTGCSRNDSTVENSVTYEELKEGFMNPPPKAHPKVYWWWLNGNIDTVRMKEELAAMKGAGISGFDIFEIGVPKSDVTTKAGPAFLSDESLKAIKTVLTEAGRLGLEAGLNMASSWNAGGSWITPEHAAKSIYFSKIHMSGNSDSPVRLPFPEISKTDSRGAPRLINFTSSGKPVYSKEIAVIAMPVSNGVAINDTSKIIDLSRLFNPESEELAWKPPSGDYDIFRFVCSNSGEELKLPSRNSAGPIIDHFDADATQFHFNYILGRIKSVIPDIENSSLKSLYLASYEATGFVWSPSLPEEYRKINGYNVNKYLPALFAPELYNAELVDRFKADFGRTLSEMMINNFYKKAKEIANSNGLKINSEAGGPGFPLHNVPVEPLKSLGSLDLPRGEFWINHNRLNEDGIDILRVVKEVSAASHIYGRGIVEEEAFTTFQHWQEAPGDMKPMGDRAFCEGMNRVVVHGFTHNPAGTGVPGIVYYAGTHYNDKRVWWSKVKPFNEYLSRISYIFQEASFKADVLYYYGDKIPNYAGHKNSRFTVAPGYDYEIINTEILLQLEIKENKLILPGGSEFSILVLEDEGVINAAVLDKIKTLADQGALITGNKPEKITRMENSNDENHFKRVVDRLWMDLNADVSSVKPGKEKVWSGISPVKLLEHIKIGPDFSYPDNELHQLDYIHYEKNNTDFYFIRNATDKWISRNCSFRQTDRRPEIWDPVSGKIFPVSVYNQDISGITMPLTLAPYESLFIVFTEKPEEPHYKSIKGNPVNPPMLRNTENGLFFLEEGNFVMTSEKTDTASSRIYSFPVDGAWELYFPAKTGAPLRIIFPELVSWTGNSNPEIKYYSGIVTYKKTFQFDISLLHQNNYRRYLDLGEISKVGDVWLNGKHLGITWTKPHRFDVTGVLKPGDNTLIIEIANTWSNRLTGDAITGEKNTETNIKTTNIKGLNKVYVPWSEVPLIESGLFGPVQLIFIRPVR